VLPPHGSLLMSSLSSMLLRVVGHGYV
jgi:hypothetical protein